jgi:hypothetical protein
VVSDPGKTTAGGQNGMVMLVGFAVREEHGAALFKGVRE